TNNVKDWKEGLLNIDDFSLPISNVAIVSVRKEDVLSSITEPTSAPETNVVKREHIETGNVWDMLDAKTPPTDTIARYTVAHNTEIEERRKSLSELLGQ